MIRAGIIGLGGIAWKYDRGVYDGVSAPTTHASCINRHPAVELVSVYDPFEKALDEFKAEYGGPEPVALYQDINAFLKSDLDLVTIASPSKFHADHIAACLDKLIPMLWIEKPVTLKLADYMTLLNRMDMMDSPPKTCVNFIRRSLPQVQYMSNYLASSKSNYEKISLEVKYSRRLDTNGVHMLDLVGAITGTTTQVPELEFFINRPNNNPQFGFSINGLKVTVTGYDLPYHLIECSLTDESGRLSLLRGGCDLTWEEAVPNKLYPGFFQLSSPRAVANMESGEYSLSEATYRMLCSLVDDSTIEISNMKSALFSQGLLEKTRGFIET